MSRVTVHLPLTGRCQCGAIAYRITEEPEVIWACHCRLCQAQTGSAFALSLLVPDAGFEITAGEPGRYVYTADSGNRRVGHYCEACGSRLANSQDPSKGVFSVRAGTLDDTSWLSPSGHIWMDSAQKWFRLPEGALTAARQPKNERPFRERFRDEFSFVPAPA